MMRANIVSLCVGLLGLAAFAEDNSQTLVIDRFEISSTDRKLGPRWAVRGWDGGNNLKNTRDYFLAEEGQNIFLRAQYIAGTKGEVYSFKKKWKSSQHPILSWRWRVHAFPKAEANFTDGAKSDAPAQVYVLFQSGLYKYIIKYAWSHSNKVGDHYAKGRWNPLGQLYAEVIQNSSQTNVWITEKRNVVEDFKRVFGKDAPSDIGGIGVLTDGDQTQSLPIADYDDFVATAK